MAFSIVSSWCCVLGLTGGLAACKTTPPSTYPEVPWPQHKPGITKLPAPPAVETENAPTAESTDSSPTALRAPWTELMVPGHNAAILAIPPTATTRAVVVAAHGAGDNPRGHCTWWREIIGPDAYVLCPRGRPLAGPPVDNTGYYYPDHYALEREVLAALDALHERYHDAATAQVLYVGFSQGATMGSFLLLRNPARFSRSILVEGTYGNSWTRAGARRFREQGGERILFVCGQSGCWQGAKKTGHDLESAGIEVRVAYGQGAGHSYAGGAVEREVIAGLPWMLERR